MYNLQPPNLPKDPNHPNIRRPGYEYLAAYQLGLVNQELTEQFTQQFIRPPKIPNLPNHPGPQPRRAAQMDEASRSVPQNIAEGHTQESLKGYIYLAGIARGSNEELGRDYARFLQKNDLAIWPRDDPRIRVFREFRVCWLSQNTLNTPNLPKDPREATNMLLTFCNMEGYLLEKLIAALKEKHRTEGGLTEKLYRARTQYRGY